MTPHSVHYGHAQALRVARQAALDAAFAGQPQALQGQAPAAAQPAHRRLDQPATKAKGHRPSIHSSLHTKFMTPGGAKSLTRSGRGRGVTTCWLETSNAFGMPTCESTAPPKVWGQLLQRRHSEVARCTVERLMKKLGPARCASAGRKNHAPRSARPRTRRACLDRVNRQFQSRRPNALWVSDFTYVSTWQGFVYVAFIIDVFCPLHRWLARVGIVAHGLRAGRAGDGAVRDSPSRRTG